MEPHFLQLKKQLQRLQIALIAIVFIFSAIVFWMLQQQRVSPDIIRAKGIVLEDSAGRDRILIGAPFPYSSSRVRTDTAMVRKHWAGQLGDDQYMKWYEGYDHAGNGMLLLNDQGFDKLIIGDHLPDPNTGKRIAEPTGMLWNDELGFERGGLGLNKLISNGKYRNALGFDDESGEAFHVVLLEDGTKLLRIVGQEGTLFLGMASQENPFLQNKTAFAGIKYFNKEGDLIFEQPMNTLRK